MEARGPLVLVAGIAKPLAVRLDNRRRICLVAEFALQNAEILRVTSNLLLVKACPLRTASARLVTRQRSALPHAYQSPHVPEQLAALSVAHYPGAIYSKSNGTLRIDSPLNREAYHPRLQP